MNHSEEVSFQVISSEQDVGFWTRWNKLVDEHGTNAFYLGGFVEYYMSECRSAGWTPLLMVMDVEDRLVGGAALKTKGIIGGRSAELLLPKVYGTDFVLDPQYREVFVHRLLRLLLVDLRCQIVDLTLPSESPNLSFMKGWCNALGLRLDRTPLREDLREHYVIDVAGNWNDFRNSRGKNFAHRFRDTEHLLKKAGESKVRQLNIDSAESEDIINTIEENSWKNTWRRERGIRSDPNLPAFFAYRKSKYPQERFPRFWLLELNGVPIAYTIIIELNGVALLCKTSYDRRYAKMSPGEYVQNAAIKEMFDSQRFSKIDFLTSLPYIQRWTSHRLARERVAILRPVPVLSTIVRTFGRSKHVRAAYKTLRRDKADR
jgi:hypothetical protein